MMLELRRRNNPFSKFDGQITGEMLAAMGDLGRTELIEGRIHYYMPIGRPHSRIAMLIVSLLTFFNLKHDLGEVHGGEIGIYTRRNPDTVRAADGAFISHGRLQDADEDGFLTVAPELIVEVLSPSNTNDEMRQKLIEYFDIGTLIVWIVDPAHKEIAVYTAVNEIELLAVGDVLTCESVLPNFSVTVAEIFGVKGDCN